MTNALHRSIAAIALSAIAFAPIVAGVSVLTADAAYANKSNSGSRGNGGGGDIGQSSEASSDNRGQDRKIARQEIMDTAGVQNWGAIASELGELNKANANINARLNSSDPVHQALGTYEMSGGITTAGVKAYIDAKAVYDSYIAGLIGQTVTDPNTQLQVIINADNVGQYAVSFEEYSGLSPALIYAYTALATLNGFREEPLTSGAIDALNYMLELEEPAVN